MVKGGRGLTIHSGYLSRPMKGMLPGVDISGGINDGDSGAAQAYLATPDLEHGGSRGREERIEERWNIDRL
jgi:hypothetical protein